jgi:hypothetical protein
MGKSGTAARAWASSPETTISSENRVQADALTVRFASGVRIIPQWCCGFPALASLLQARDQINTVEDVAGME